MARNRITNPKKLKKLSLLLNEKIVMAYTRGGTNHRIDCACEDGSVYHYFKKSNEKILSDWLRYDQEKKLIASIVCPSNEE